MLKEKLLFAVLLVLFVAQRAMAQPQQPQQSTVLQVMQQDAAIKAVLSEQLDAAHKQVQQLTSENAELKKQLADKTEPAKKP